MTKGLALVAALATLAAACIGPQSAARPPEHESDRLVQTSDREAPATYVGFVRPRCGDADPVCVTFLDDLGKDLELRHVLITLDDSAVFAGRPPETLGGKIVFSGSVSVGEHVVQVRAYLEGEGSLSGYRFEVQSTHNVEVHEQVAHSLAIVLDRLTDPALPPQATIRIRYVENARPL